MNTSDAAVSVNVYARSGALPPPHDPDCVDAPLVAPVNRPPVPVTFVAPAQLVPQAETHIDPFGTNPGLHVNPQLVPSHVALPFAGTLQGVQSEPQFATLPFDTHAPPQSWNPVLHVWPQLVPSQVAVAFAGGEHGVHEDPQVLTLLSLTHTPPHA
jgi:hypothetical protein